MSWWLAVIIGYLTFVAGLAVGGFLGNAKYEERMAELEKRYREVMALWEKLTETVKWRGK